jgi:Protein of unknown function (DUF1822)
MFSALVESTDYTLQIPQDRQTNIWQQSRTFPTAWGRWNAYLNQLCLEICLTWLKAEHLPTAKAGMAPALWEMVTGSIVTVGNMRIALILTETIDRSELAVPQEWVDIPSWAADYYLGVQIDPDCQSLAIYGFTTHQQLKTQATYDAQERTYCLDVDELIPDLSALWLAYPRYTTSQTRASLTALPALDPTQAERLITRLGNPELIMPRLEVPFQTWAALLEHPQWQQRLCQQRQTGNSIPVFTQLNRWLVGQIDEVWQSLEACASSNDDRVLLPQQIAIAVRSTTSSSVEITPGDVYQAQVFNLDSGQIALVVGISPVAETESRISLQVHPAGGAAYLPGETQLRLLAADGSEIGKVSAAVTETIQLQFLASAGEQFEIEIACGGQILTERFEV